MSERRRLAGRAAGNQKVDSRVNLPRDKVAKRDVINRAILAKGSNQGCATSSELHETKITRTGKGAKLIFR